jgi:hypothetical protein
VSYRDTLEGLVKRTRRNEKRAEYEEELWMPEFPMAAMYLWRAYHRMRGRKGGNGFGVSPLEWSDIEAFNRMSGMRLLPWEVTMIEKMDDLWLRSMAETMRNNANG